LTALPSGFASTLPLTASSVRAHPFPMPEPSPPDDLPSSPLLFFALLPLGLWSGLFSAPPLYARFHRFFLYLLIDVSEVRLANGELTAPMEPRRCRWLELSFSGSLLPVPPSKRTFLVCYASILNHGLKFHFSPKFCCLNDLFLDPLDQQRALGRDCRSIGPLLPCIFM